tara:strand:+ start:763 stop:1035 length:273 start_codon:yes stop_codon:yes gene_type:complete
MKSLRYLNTVLTLIAVLLTVNIWTLWNVTPGGGALSVATEAQANGIPNAGQQRKDIVDAIKRLNADTVAMKNTLANGTIKVKIEGGLSQD